MDEPIVVDTGWLSDRALELGLAIVDVRPPPFYAQEHIPGAVNLPAFLLSSPDGGLPSPDALARRLGSLGIARDTPVVAYDDGASPAAAGLFRVLTYYRHPWLAVLDGGITKWRHEGRDVEYAPARPLPTNYEIGAPDTASAAGMDDVRRAINAEDAVLVDVRSPAEYLGLQHTALRDGHIPGAINIDWSNNLTRDDDYIVRLRSDDELRRLYEQAGVTPDKEVIVYCQSGSRTSETFLVLKKLGYPRVVVYDRGWQEWGNRSDTPIDSE